MADSDVMSPLKKEMQMSTFANCNVWYVISYSEIYSIENKSWENTGWLCILFTLFWFQNTVWFIVKFWVCRQFIT